ncbi:unnamed protein product [Paramecium octaurelia]|uniref:Uncharacterized protein n=1 Tax=Paramecium octaurelia TaxID=43137 RepID=A0A8S1WFM1_PAROT|nr:unnamed protein product [Paramecium octaurelia]
MLRIWTHLQSKMKHPYTYDYIYTISLFISEFLSF